MYVCILCLYVCVHVCIYMTMCVCMYVCFCTIVHLKTEPRPTAVLMDLTLPYAIHVIYILLHVTACAENCFLGLSPMLYFERTGTSRKPYSESYDVRHTKSSLRRFPQWGSCVLYCTANCMLTKCAVPCALHGCHKKLNCVTKVMQCTVRATLRLVMCQ